MGNRPQRPANPARMITLGILRVKLQHTGSSTAQAFSRLADAARKIIRPAPDAGRIFAGILLGEGRLHPDPGFLGFLGGPQPPPPLKRVADCPHPDSEQVKGQGRKEDRHAWHHHYPPGGYDVLPSLGQH